MPAARDLVVATLGTRPVSRLVRMAGVDGVRIVAYHGIADRYMFEEQLKMISADFSVVSGSDVAAALRGDGELPPRPVWLTFDDGLSSVVEYGLPALDAQGLPATIFACPGLVASGDAHWWDVVMDAVDRGWRTELGTDPAGAVRRLKQLPDRIRRSHLDDARRTFGDELGRRADPPASIDQLRRWMASGRELGNHTWDHPCLDQCDDEAQLTQLRTSDDWLEHVGAFDRVRLFAYPNGDWTDTSDRELRTLGYDCALLFDHRLAQPTSDPLRLSRLRLDASASVGRARAVLSGAHSWFVRR